MWSLLKSEVERELRRIAEAPGTERGYAGENRYLLLVASMGTCGATSHGRRGS